MDQGVTGTRVIDPVTARNHQDYTWSLTSWFKEHILFSYYPMSSGYEANGYGLINLDWYLLHYS
jgi:beta-galactosidase